MAIVVINKAQSGNSSTTLTITSAKAGNWLVMAVVQNTSTTSITGHDNISGSTGWTTDTNDAIFQSSGDSIWYMYKQAVGGETTLSPVAGGSGTIVSIAYVELAGFGSSLTVDGTPQVKSNNATAITTTTKSYTTSAANDIMMAFVGLGTTGSGTQDAWTNTGPMTLIGSGTTSRVVGGYYLPGSIQTNVQFTANWTTSQTIGNIVTALTPSTSINVIQRGGGGNTASNPTFTFGVNNTSGNMIVVIATVAATSLTGYTISDTKSNTYTMVASNDNGTQGYIAWICYSCAAGANTVTLNNTGAVASSVNVWEINNAASSNALDGVSVQYQSSATSLSSGNITTTNANDILLCAVGSITGAVYTAGTNFVNLFTTTSGISTIGAAEEEIVSSTGTYSGTMTANVSLTNAVTVVIAISNNPIGGGAVVAPTHLLSMMGMGS